MPKHTRKRNTNTKRTRKLRKTNNKNKKVRKISNPSGLSHLYTSIYGPRAYKGGIAPVMVL